MKKMPMFSSCCQYVLICFIFIGKFWDSKIFKAWAVLNITLDCVDKFLIFIRIILKYIDSTFCSLWASSPLTITIWANK